MKKIKTYNYFMGLVFIGYSCNLAILSGSGTHGSIKEYSYPISKVKVDSTIQYLIRNNPKISKIEGDGNTYNTVLIKDVKSYYFVFRFQGNENDFKTHPNESKFFITAIKIDNGEYKKEAEIETSEMKEAINVFKNEFVFKLDSILGEKSVETK